QYRHRPRTIRSTRQNASFPRLRSWHRHRVRVPATRSTTCVSSSRGSSHTPPLRIITPPMEASKPLH
ncbi:hypothetical protein EV175_007429, partial [Coemansia sp. RSA 1933]